MQAAGATQIDPASPHWRLLGAGNMGTLAAYYLLQAGHGVTVVRRGIRSPLRKTLCFAQNKPTRKLALTACTPETIGSPIEHLLVACKTPYSDAALSGLPIADNAVVLRLQNGIGSLDGHLPAAARLIELVTASAVKGEHPRHQVVAENQTAMGGIDPEPPWWRSLSCHWPNLTWRSDIRHTQWHKLVANAAINPLTALHNVANGRLLYAPRLRADMNNLVAEADNLLGRMDPTWPGDSLARVEAIARATAGNTSSMRADIRRGAPTEIAAINGWLLRQADRLGVDLPGHRNLVTAIEARSGDSSA